MYIFLKEYLDNEHVYKIFKDWAEMSDHFAGRTKLALFEWSTRNNTTAFSTECSSPFAFIRTTSSRLRWAQARPSLWPPASSMNSCWPTNSHQIHASVITLFAPDTTVLESLREIQTFDMTKVVPPNTPVFFQAISNSTSSMNRYGTQRLDKSRFNIIISNTQKIILKRQSTEKTAMGPPVRQRKTHLRIRQRLRWELRSIRLWPAWGWTPINHQSTLRKTPSPRTARYLCGWSPSRLWNQPRELCRRCGRQPPNQPAPHHRPFSWFPAKIAGT